MWFGVFVFNYTATTEIYTYGHTLSLHDALPIFDDAVERGPVDDEVAQHGEGGCTPGLDVDVLAVAEHAHVQLAGGGALLGTVGLAVDHHPAGSADALAAVVLEGDRIPALGVEALVHDVEHLEEAHLFADARSEEHTSELQSLMRISYAVFCLKK